MSVRKEDRVGQKLKVLDSARILKKYTLSMLQVEEHFPKRTRWLIAYPIKDAIRSAYSNIRKANAINVKTQTDYEIRRGHQNEAHASLTDLFDLIEDAENLGHKINIEYWSGLTSEVDDLLISWMKSDENRYHRFLK